MEEEINEDEELVDVDILEFSLNDEEIDELIEKLKKLKQTKKEIEFNIDEENELFIHHEDDEELDNEEINEDEEEIGGGE